MCWRFGPLLIELICAMPLYFRIMRPTKLTIATKTALALVGLWILSLTLSLMLVAASFYTVMSHVYLLTNLCGCLELIVAIALCRPTHTLERGGLMLALIGVFIMIADPRAVKDGEPVNIIVDLLTLLVNIPWIGYFRLF